MKTVLNKTQRPLRVKLPKGKVLHLGPRRYGQIAVHHVEFEPVQKLLAAGELEIVDAAAVPTRGDGRRASGHPETHGHHPAVAVPKRGDR